MSASSPEPQSMPVWRQVLTADYLKLTALFCFSVWVHAADSTLVSTMIPAMVSDIGGTRLISWTVSLYETGTIVAGAASGLLIMRYGLRTPMTIAAISFSAGCLISGLAGSMEVVLVGRILQGLGGGALISISFVGAATLFPKNLVPGILAVVSGVWGTSAFLGPLFGGIFVEIGSWRYGFLLFCFKAFLLAIWIFKTIPDQSKPLNTAPGDHNVKSFPLLRLSLLVFGVIAISAAGVVKQFGLTILLVALGAMALVRFLQLDRLRDSNRMLPRNSISFRDPVGSGTTMIFCFTIATIASTVYGPFLLVSLYGVSALVAGYIAAAVSVGWTLGALIFAGTRPENDARVIKVGMWLLTITVIGLSVAFGRTSLWVIGTLTLLQGFGFGMAWALILRRSMSRAGPSEQQRIPAAMPTLQRLGYALGAAMAGIIANTTGLVLDADPDMLRQVASRVFAIGIPFAVLGLWACHQFTRDVAAVE